MNFLIFFSFLQGTVQLFMENNKHIKFLIAGVLLLLYLSCSPIQQYRIIDAPLKGIIYTKVSYTPRATKMNAIGEGRPLKKGTNCSWSFAYLNSIWYETGGGSIQRAARSAQITKIAAIEKEITLILGFLASKECIIIWGE